MRFDRSNHGGSRRDKGTFADNNARNDGRTRSDKTVTSAGNLSGEVAAWRNLDIVLNDVVVIDNGAGINDSEGPDSRSGVDDDSCHHDSPMTDFHVWGDDSRGVHKRDEVAAGRQDHFGKKATSGGIADSNNKPMRCNKSRNDLVCRSFGFESCRSSTRIVVDEARDWFACGSRNVCNHTAMGAASDDLYGPFQVRHDGWISGWRTMRECGSCRHGA